ncbi:hypothetical protein [Piscinibacter koreensis]|uniref:Uncharacterized protein n=1 Tax=Piscinibacter koreensis TaxID=2742824 RepID=A0A7Y6TZG4_9BURK|nr:hypothetical protein [Schlegelella koreensis]NUZ09122.1 hypothetical protein [Schlegelella koreensis]
MKKLPTASEDVPDMPVVVQSDDGSIRIWLRMTQFGLWVRRERRRADAHARLVQSVVFRDPEGFERWCDSDSIRFEYPVVSSAVKREGGALLDDHERTTGAQRSR